MRTFAAIAVVVAGAALFTGTSARDSRAATAAPALFTHSQAIAGGKTYDAKCSRCHGANLEGVSAPALRGSGSGLAGDSVGEAFTFISTQMPAGDPGSLSSREYVNVVAYILSRNGHAPGPLSLTPAAAKKSRLKV